MSVCECGADIMDDKISCSSCGKRLTVDPLITFHFPKEPPINSWKREIEEKSRSFSEESMREVREEAKRRSETKMLAK